MEGRDISGIPAWMTPSLFVAIGIGMVLALAMILWGSWRRRAKAAARKRADAHRPSAALLAEAAAAAPPPPRPRVAVTSAPPLDPVAIPPADAEPVPLPPPAPPAAPAPAPAPAPVGEARPLTLLKGLGPKAAARLAELGVASIEALAARSDAELAALDAALGPLAGRIARDRWAEQARLLAAGDVAGFEARFGKLGG